MEVHRLKNTQTLLSVIQPLVILGILVFIPNSMPKILILVSLALVLLPINIALFYKINSESEVSKKNILIQYLALILFIGITAVGLFYSK